MNGINGDVLIEAGADAGEAERVLRAFGRVGLEVEVATARETRGVGAVTDWIVQWIVNDTIEGFFLAMGAAGFKFFVLDLIESRRGRRPHGRIDVSDTENSHLLIPSSIPSSALDALADLDWKSLRGGYLVWRAADNSWEDNFA